VTGARSSAALPGHGEAKHVDQAVGCRAFISVALTARGRVGTNLSLSAENDGSYSKNAAVRVATRDSELDSVTQPVEDDRDQTLDRGLRGHCTCSFKGVEAKGRQFVRRYIASDSTGMLGLCQ
jgi:hypothetical protein